jgi:hypothetical protein
MGGSRYELALCALEQAILEFRMGDHAQSAHKLDSLYSFFHEEGFHLEALRAEYFHLLGSLLHELTREQNQIG